MKGADFPKPEDKCFFQCLGEINGVVEGTKVDFTKFFQALEQCTIEQQNMMLQIGRKCLHVKHKDICERCYLTHLCWRSADLGHYFF